MKDHDLATPEQAATCPHTILEPDHYRKDSTCRCDDPDHISMVDWGYTWNETRWTA